MLWQSLCSRAACRLLALSLLGGMICATGCGTTKSQSATEQLLLSDAVDRSIAELDFRVLANQKVYLDTQYLKNIKGPNFVNADYIISSLRQQMFAAHCLLQDKPEEADFIVEARVGALGNDGHDVTYGVPASNALSNAASVVPGSPPIPTIPEISLARRHDQLGASKVAVFAYDRETKEPVWQSGISTARSTARDTWVFGAGPFQRGTIYEGTQFAGSQLSLPIAEGGGESDVQPVVGYDREVHFVRPQEEGQQMEAGGSEVQPATFEAGDAKEVGQEPTKEGGEAKAEGQPAAEAASKP